MMRLRAWLLGGDRRMRALLARMHRDEGGQIIVLYVAASLLLVGMLWAIIGTGARVVQKETIQSSADAAAFSAAVIKAKGLNIIAFCNLVMALLLAILMLLRLIKGALMIVLGICLAACFDVFGGEVLCGLAPSVQQLYQQYSNLLDQVEPRIMDAMRGLAQVERGVNKTFPALSLLEALRVGTNKAYRRNMSPGGLLSLITVSFPLPLGDDLTLPTEDGKWGPGTDSLCDQADKTFGRVLQIAIAKMGMPAIGDVLGGAVSTLLSPLEGILCGDGSSNQSSNVPITTTENKTSCGDCSNAQSSMYSGDKIITDASGNEIGTVPGTCTIDGFSGMNCPSGAGPLACNDGAKYKNLHFQMCNVKVDATANLGGQVSGNKPLPLVFKETPKDGDAPYWKAHSQVRAFTLLTDTNMDQRRQSVGVATRHMGGRPNLNQMLTMAQAEWFAFNRGGPGGNHEDLWHMDWRARLVRFMFTDVNSHGGDGNAAGIGQAIESFLNSAGAALKDEFMVH
jgi:hypothetical protein